MSRYNHNVDEKPILDAAADWAKNCLLEDRSVLLAGQSLWTVENLTELDARFVKSADYGAGSFIEKLKAQLAPSTSHATKLMAELLWLHFLFSIAVSPRKKREIIDTIWTWSGDPLDQNQLMLSDTVLSGVANPGTAYNTHRFLEVAYLIGVFQSFKQLNGAVRREVLDDPWAFSRWLAGVPQEGNRQSRHILRHLLFPDTFERTATTSDKQRLVSHFDRLAASEVKKWDDERIDRAVLEIRHRLESQARAPVDFYEASIRALWQDMPPASVRTWLLVWNPSKWDWAELAVDRMAAASGKPVTMSWRCANSEVKVGDAALLVRVGVPPKGLIARGTITSAPYQAPHYDPERADGGEMTAFVDVSLSAIRDAKIDPMVSLDDLDRAAPEQKWASQSSGVQVNLKAATQAKALWDALPPILNQDLQINKEVPPAREKLIVSDPINLILYGPPGTGKTHRLLSAFVGNYQQGRGALSERCYEFVTFHQSYSYEDFVEGIRPVTEGGAITYEVRPGVFRRLCERAKLDPRRRYAIFIDEINRGNVAKILGELISLLEPDKRTTYDVTGQCVQGLEITLPYSGQLFGVPKNVDVYGTMNTADRSVSLLDAALRRRFQFEELVPTPGAILGAGDNGRIPDGMGGEIDLRSLLETLNARLTHLLNRDQTIGHAYFIRVKDFLALRRVLALEIVPLLQEYFYDDWDRIRAVLADDTGIDEDEQLVRRATVTPDKLFPGSTNDSLSESFRYSVTPELEITPDALRKIYETPV